MYKTEADSWTSRTNLWWTFFFRQGFTVAPAIAGGEWEETTSSLLTHRGASSLLLIWGEGRGISGRLGWRAGFRWFAQPSGGSECRGHAQYPAFAPNSLLLLPTLCFPSRFFRNSIGICLGFFLFFVFLYLDILHSMDLDKTIMTCLPHYSIIQSTFTDPTILCAPSILPNPWPLLIFLLS